MKKLLSLVLAMMMVLSLAPAMAEEPIEIIVGVEALASAGWPASPEEDPIYQKILDATGVSWKITLVDDYWNGMSSRILNENIPDIFFIDAAHQDEYANEGVLLNLDPYLDNELKDVMDFLGSTNRIPYIINGSLYSVPRLFTTGTGSGTKNQWALHVRQDWLDNLGLEAPTDIESLYEVAKAFSENDPDGNGLDDTFGITGGKGIRGFHIIGMCFDYAFGNYVIERDGKITNSLLQPGAVEALEWAKKFVDEDLMDPDIMTTNGTDNAVAGKVGMHMFTWPNMYKQFAIDNMKAIDPDAYWIPTGPLENELGDNNYMFPYDNVGGGDSFALSADLAKPGNEEKLEAVFKVLNYLASDEGSYLVMFGVEGVHWNMVDGKPVMVAEKAEEVNHSSTYQLMSRIEAPYLTSKFPEAERAFSYTMSVPMYEYLNTLVDAPEEVYLSDMESYITSQLAAFVYGEREISQEEYDAFIQELNDQYNFDLYMEAATEQLNGYGYGK